MESQKEQREISIILLQQQININQLQEHQQLENISRWGFHPFIISFILNLGGTEVM